MTGTHDDMRFSALWAAFLKRVKATTGTGNHRNHEKIGRLYLIPALGNMRVSRITQQNMQDIVDSAYKKGKSKKYLMGIRASMTAVRTYADKSNVSMARTDTIEIPRDAPMGERRILRPTDLATLFKEDIVIRYGKPISSHYIYAWRFIVLTGLRPGEVYGLRREDVEGGIVRILRARNADGEETRGENDNARRWFSLAPVTQGILDDQAAMLKEKGIISPWVFPDERGVQSFHRHVYKMWKAYRERHGIVSSLYELRHTMISIVSADLPDKLLKAVVGHSESMDTHGIYVHEVDGEAKRASEIIDAAFRRLLE